MKKEGGLKMKERSWDNCPFCNAKLLREYWGMSNPNTICWRYSCDNKINGKLCVFGVKMVERPINDDKPIKW